MTDAMASCGDLFEKFGGHAAAGGFSFKKENLEKIKQALADYARDMQASQPDVWRSKKRFDCQIPGALLDYDLLDCLDVLKPFGHGFDEPIFQITATVASQRYYNDKATGKPKHTALQVDCGGRVLKLLFFNEVIEDLEVGTQHAFLVTVSRNVFRGRVSLDLMGIDWS